MPHFATFSELAAYLMVFMARADGQIHYLEETTLTDQMRRFSGDPGNLLRGATEVCEANPQASVEEVLKANDPLIGRASYDERMELIRSLYGIINADGRVREEEMSTLRAIRTALEHSEGVAPIP